MTHRFWLLLVTCSSLVLAGCVSNDSKTPLPSIKQGVYGKVFLYTGNCMPQTADDFPDFFNSGKGCRYEGANTTVFVTAISSDFQQKNLVKSAGTIEGGFFEIELPAGNYSLFVQDGNKMLCDRTRSWPPNDKTGRLVCMPFSVEEGKVTEVNATIDNAVW